MDNTRELTTDDKMSTDFRAVSEVFSIPPGLTKLTLTNFSGVNSTSIVLASVCELNPGPIIGSGVFTVHEVAPGDKQVSVRVELKWTGPLVGRLSVLVIN